MIRIDSGEDWSFEKIEEIYLILEKIAIEKYGLKFYTNQLEVITSDQMLDAYSSVGMPIMYNHWSFGKQFIREKNKYMKGQMGLAYEIVINSNPARAYLMEENTMIMQTLVIAHACFGHNSLFTNNVHFKTWTDAGSILDYLSFAKTFVRECEEKYGEAEVVAVLDACHALQLYGVDKYKRASPPSKDRIEQRKKQKQKYAEMNLDDVWRTVPKEKEKKTDEDEIIPAHPEENLLYWLEKNVPNPKQWKIELFRIVRKIAQYFYPQRFTQVVNEGWATFMHYNLMHDLYEMGHITDGGMLEFYKSHTGVVHQHRYSPLNPYAIGFAMFEDIKRVSTNPTTEDEKWFENVPGLIRGNWLENVKYAAFNFRDEDFYLQYLSPKVIRDFSLFHLHDDPSDMDMIVQHVQDERGYKMIREFLSQQANPVNSIPAIEVVRYNKHTDRSLHLVHHTTKGHTLDLLTARQTLWHFTQLWGYLTTLATVETENGKLVEKWKIESKPTDIFPVL